MNTKNLLVGIGLCLLSACTEVDNKLEVDRALEYCDRQVHRTLEVMMDSNLSHISPTSVRSTSETLRGISEKKKVPRYRRYCNKKCPAKRQGTLKYQVKLTVISLSASQQ